jgi:hypothetical protein
MHYFIYPVTNVLSMENSFSSSCTRETDSNNSEGNGGAPQQISLKATTSAREIIAVDARSPVK